MFFHVMLTSEGALELKSYIEKAKEIGKTRLKGRILLLDKEKTRYALLRDHAILTNECDLQCKHCFGGEPLFCVDEIKRSLDDGVAKHFLLSTRRELMLICFH